jgi:hypothetical protein
MNPGYLGATLSPSMKYADLDKGGVAGALEAAHEAFKQGHRYALFEVVVLCACVQATIPEWATDALMEMHEHLEDERKSGDWRDHHEQASDRD